MIVLENQLKFGVMGACPTSHFKLGLDDYDNDVQTLKRTSSLNAVTELFHPNK